MIRSKYGACPGSNNRRVHSIYAGWRRVQGVCSMSIGIVWIIASILVPGIHGPGDIELESSLIFEDNRKTLHKRSAARS
jgi:hypothetical protein